MTRRKIGCEVKNLLSVEPNNSYCHGTRVKLPTDGSEHDAAHGPFLALSAHTNPLKTGSWTVVGILPHHPFVGWEQFLSLGTGCGEGNPAWDTGDLSVLYHAINLLQCIHDLQSDGKPIHYYIVCKLQFSNSIFCMFSCFK